MLDGIARLDRIEAKVDALAITIGLRLQAQALPPKRLPAMGADGFFGNRGHRGVMKNAKVTRKVCWQCATEGVKKDAYEPTDSPNEYYEGECADCGTDGKLYEVTRAE